MLATRQETKQHHEEDSDHRGDSHEDDEVLCHEWFPGE
jgi:hypothetical protein